jgi:hypothetical protein
VTENVKERQARCVVVVVAMAGLLERRGASRARKASGRGENCGCVGFTVRANNKLSGRRAIRVIIVVGVASRGEQSNGSEGKVAVREGSGWKGADQFIF